ncbi:F-box only protein 16 [Dunckerocampus dactyliophorus]|uniref:F-box only protein 16 n=1 Tax=Dunckerocampus dactyliophorus TaxID=161453 RepID=UPI00240529BD|nr:F-box only protein 16 [Dunckerocampus dactyliophorus]
MPHAASGVGMQTKLSTWTPLNHSPSNSKLFEERRSLLAKWFDRWSDSQRRLVLQDFIMGCSQEQLRFVSLSVSRQLPLLAADFTCLLPRTTCLYIFSFLDPRSLCRCAQVSWHWKSIVELDRLWMPKCLRLGWCISFSPTVFEQGVWKRHYIQTVQEMLLVPIKKVWMRQQAVVPDAAPISKYEDMSALSEGRATATTQEGGRVSRSRLKTNHPPVPPPWRDSDRCPKDTVRFNYLDNSDPIRQAIAAEMKSRATTCSSKTDKGDDGRQKTLSDTNYKLRKAKSLMFLTSNCDAHHPPPRPHWASHSQGYPVTKEAGQNLLGLAQWNAGKRPGPVRMAVPRLSVEALRASQRSNRSVPSAPLFEFHPWTSPLTLTQHVD